MNIVTVDVLLCRDFSFEEFDKVFSDVSRKEFFTEKGEVYFDDCV